ncbi:MAG: glycosyltransferase family 9 protein [Candidatus Margulisiibacteriota bacterium]
MSKRILLVRPDAIGDVVLMIPLINTLKTTFPDCQISVLLQPYTQAILDNHPQVDEVILDWKKAGKIQSFKDTLAYARFLKDKHFDAVLLPFSDDYYVRLMFLARIPIRIADGNKLGIRPFLTHPVPIPFRNALMHETEQNLKLVEPLVKVWKAAKLMPNLTMDLAIDAQAKVDAQTLLAEAGWTGEPLVMIHPSSGGGNRHWIPEAYGRLIDRIKAEGPHNVVVTGFGQKDLDLVARMVATAQSKPLVLAGKTSLEQLKAVIALCRVVIGTDTGPTHMAAALKVPVVSVSPTKFVKSLRWGPWQTPNRVVGNPSACPYVCNPYRCRLPDCLEALTVDRVDQAVQAVLGNPTLPDDGAMKQAWFVASMNVMIALDGDATEPDYRLAGHYVELAKIAGLPAVVVVETHKQALRFRQYHHHLIPVVIPKWQVVSMVDFLMRKDITLIHHLNPKWRWYWMVLRQIAALKVYCPPVPVFFKQQFAKADGLVAAYYREFEAYF